jgi:hypothetical protein
MLSLYYLISSGYIYFLSIYIIIYRARVLLYYSVLELLAFIIDI